MALFNAILQKDNQGSNRSSSSSTMKMPGEEELEKANEKPAKRLRSKQPLNDKAEDKAEVQSLRRPYALLLTPLGVKSLKAMT